MAGLTGVDFFVILSTSATIESVSLALGRATAAAVRGRAESVGNVGG